MLQMEQYDYIRTAYRVYGHSIRRIAKDTKHSRNTIKLILKNEFSSYKARSSQPFPALQEYLSIIDLWLTEDRQNPKKQRHTARRIFHRLVSEHQYLGSESAVRKYVRQAKAKLGFRESLAFLPLVPEAGHEAEVDWGVAQVILKEEKIQVHYFCMRAKYSGKRFFRFYENERQQAFFDAHIRAFEFFGGVFPTLIYDNLKTAIKEILTGKKRVEQEEFQKFRAYYSFEARFCNPGKGHEKGGVEGAIGFARRNYMVPFPKGDSLEELNEKLLKDSLTYGEHQKKGSEKNVNELFEEERSYLLALPEFPYENLRTFEGKVDKYATVLVEKNRYSVPCRYAGFKVVVLLYVERVEVFYRNKQLAKHKRTNGKEEWNLNPLHYLELMQQRPQGFKSSRVYKQWKEEWPEGMNQLLKRFCEYAGERKGIKEFIKVLNLFNEYKKSELLGAIEIANQGKISSSEGVKQLLNYMNEEEEKSVPLRDWPTFEPPDLEVYKRLEGE